MALERLEDRTLLAADFSVTLEAESAVLNGPVAASNHVGYTGEGFADFQKASGESIRWTVVAPEAGNYELSLRYALATGDRPLRILANGENVEASLSMPATGGWDLWDSAKVVARLHAGENTIEALSIGSSGANVDSITISGTDEIAAVTYEAESASLTGAVVASDHQGYTGSGFVDYLHAVGDSIEWSVQAEHAGDYLLTFRYALDDSSTPFNHENRPLALEIGGQMVESSLTFSRTGSGGSWTTWGEVELAATLTQGTNSIRLTATGESGANINHLRVQALSSGDTGSTGTGGSTHPSVGFSVVLGT